MKEKWYELETLLAEEKSVTVKECWLITAVAFLLGLVLGMFLSPKKNVTIGSNNGSNNIGPCGDIFEEEEEAQDEKCC